MIQLTDRLDFTNEQKWQAIWEAARINDFDEADAAKPVYSIDTPPPFTSGDLHMGHVLSYSYFDFVARYKRMKGFNVYYPQGWDCQGFPTETRVEQKYGRKPPEEFRKLCVEWTHACIVRMRAQMKSLGFSADWRYEYRTMDPAYHKLVQKSILLMYESKQIYRGEHPVFWCPHCQSALAKTDTEDVERQTQLHDIRFQLELDERKEAGKSGGRPDAGPLMDIVVATTRPELMHACVAVLFHPEDERYKGLAVQSAITALGAKVPFKADPDVDPAFGSGVVMVCTFGDKQDVVWMYRHKLPIIRALDERGKLINAPPSLTALPSGGTTPPPGAGTDGASEAVSSWPSGLSLNGLSISDARAKLLDKFKSEGKLLSSKPLAQVVKVHDRCKKPVELSLSWQWFAKITESREKIIQAASQMRWVPEFAISYLEDWARFVEWDWVISRQRVFGTPLPFWHCVKCDKTVPAEERELPVNPPAMEKKCPACRSPLVPEASTCDCWMDSSVSPLAISKWGEDSKFFKRTYPASLRPQGVEIVRTWAFYTIYRCLELTGKPPFGELLLNGNVLAPDGKKMSKSLGNIIAPDKLLTDYGADCIRIWAALSGAMARDRPFSYQDVQYAKSFLNKLLNAGKLVQKSVEGYAPDEGDEKHLRPIDRYFLHRLNEVTNECDLAWEDFEFHRIIKTVQEFFWHEFCDYYLEYVKYRIYAEGKDKETLQSKRAAQYTLSRVYRTTLLLLAPIAPHSSEELWQMFRAGETDLVSKHAYPAPDQKMAHEKSVPVGQLLAQIISAIRQEKAARKLSLNAPIPQLDLVLTKEQHPHLKSIEEEIKFAGRAEKIEVKEGDALKVSFA